MIQSPREELLSPSRKGALFYFVVGAVLFLLLGLLAHNMPGQQNCDFKALYTASKAFLQHHDPYRQANLVRAYQSLYPGYHPILSQVDTIYVNLPSTVVLLAPFALLPWTAAQVLWSALTAVSVIFAAWLMWDLAYVWSPRVAGILTFVVLSGSQALLFVGNPAGLVIGLVTIGAWCFVREKNVAIGVACMAIALLIKPQDAGFIWLYFLLIGGRSRRRALQTLAIVIPVACWAAISIAQISPDWMIELRQNLMTTMGPEQVNNPLATRVDPLWPGSMIVSLQTVTGVFWTDPRIYNGVAYLVLVPLIVFWALKSKGSRPDPARAWIALATIVPLSMLAGYHRQHDTRLLLLALPACAMLAARKDRVGRLAVVFTSIAALASSNLVLPLFGHVSYGLRDRMPGLGGKLLYAIVGRPVPLALLVMSGFYCWLLLRPALLRDADLSVGRIEEDGPGVAVI
ncbi:glycosyltransferase family 87 protein [Occallatibacter riparius]|uniref:DUF2029 domain-containing protein n=1 Tax=Occallatibacter riparius TaxID=1002689 RepID=A0A9J7BL09_9BACT|nr:glycosyltransferase family 87 protein [Occallatibacter riparius]UWZ82450.1 DUF2029 domain-containing protein [Occallatibacter riparius]